MVYHQQILERNRKISDAPVRAVAETFRGFLFPFGSRSPLTSVSNAAAIFRDLRSAHTNWDALKGICVLNCYLANNYVVTRSLHNDPDALMHDDLGSISSLLSNVLWTGAVQYFCLCIFIITTISNELNPGIWRSVSKAAESGLDTFSNRVIFTERPR